MKTDTKCCECGLPCDAMCPACGRAVHQAYGQWNSANCGNEHAESCVESTLEKEAERG